MANSGGANLSGLVHDLRQRGILGGNQHPIVLVAGLASFGDPFLGSVNYWGGFEDLAGSLQAYTGVPVILPRIGPFSTNWERACELYRQLDNIQAAGDGTGFDRPGNPPTPLGVDYGNYIPLPAPPPHSTKQAVVIGALRAGWRWSAADPVHMICHSQGGNTVRLLIELLSGGYGHRHQAYFGVPGNRQNFVRSVVTLGTPYLGTSITNVIFDDILRDVQVHEIISRLVVSACLNPARFVDLQLDQWGFTPLPNETFSQMHGRLGNDIRNWWTGDDNAVKDNGIAGVNRLNRDFSSPGVSAETYYFTMSFDATRPFPHDLGHLSGEDLANFPPHPWLGPGFPGPFNIFATIAANAFNGIRGVPGNPADLAYVKWAVEFFNNRLNRLGYRIRVPSPGGRIPRADMLPALSLFSLGMSGRSTSLGLSAQNDGVVDTSSMRAPANQPVRDINIFNSAALPANRAVYWDLGLTEGVDHADQIGVFTDANTYTNVVLPMYQDLGDLLSAL